MMHGGGSSRRTNVSSGGRSFSKRNWNTKGGGINTGSIITMITMPVIMLFILMINKCNHKNTSTNSEKTTSPKNERVKSPLTTQAPERKPSLDEVNGLNIDEPLNISLAKIYKKDELFIDDFPQFGVESVNDIKLMFENGKSIIFKSNEIDDKSVRFSYTENPYLPLESGKTNYLQGVRFHSIICKSHKEATDKATKILNDLGLDTSELSNAFANRYQNNQLKTTKIYLYQKGNFKKDYTRYKDAVVRITLEYSIGFDNYEEAIITTQLYLKTIE